MSGVGFIGAGRGGGATTFTELTDTPDNYTDRAERLLAIKDTEDGLEDLLNVSYNLKHKIVYERTRYRAYQKRLELTSDTDLATVINACETDILSDGVGGLIELNLLGEHELTEEIVNYDNVTLEGLVKRPDFDRTMGTLLKAADAYTDDYMIRCPDGEAHAQYNIQSRIRKLGLHGNEDNVAGLMGIYMQSPSRGLIEWNTLIEFDAEAIYCGDAGGTLGFHTDILYNYIKDNNNRGIRNVNVDEGSINHNQFGSHGIDADNMPCIYSTVGHNEIIHNKMVQVAGRGIHVNGRHDIKRNMFDRVVDIPLFIDNADESRVINNWFFDVNWGAAEDDDAIVHSASDYVDYFFNQFKHSTKRPVYCIDLDTSDYVRIRFNDMRSHVTAAVESAAAGGNCDIQDNWT